jgi:hypothetical protein
MYKNMVEGVKVLKNGKNLRYYGKRVIDATQDAYATASAGVPYTIGAENIGIKNQNQLATLMFKLTGIDWHYIEKLMESNSIHDVIYK